MNNLTNSKQFKNALKQLDDVLNKRGFYIELGTEKSDIKILIKAIPEITFGKDK